MHIGPSAARGASALALALLVGAGCDSRAGAGRMTGAVVGGREATPDDFAATVYWQVGAVRCSGAVVGPRHVLTAAHCVTASWGGPAAFDPGDTIWVSTDERFDADADRLPFAVASVAIHPSWDTSDPPHIRVDVAIIEVMSELPYARARIDQHSVEDDEVLWLSGYDCDLPDAGYGQGYPVHRIAQNRVEPAYNAALHQDFHTIPEGGETAYVCPANEREGGAPIYRGDPSAHSIVGVTAGSATLADGVPYSAFERLDTIPYDGHASIADWLTSLVPAGSLCAGPCPAAPDPAPLVDAGSLPRSEADSGPGDVFRFDAGPVDAGGGTRARRSRAVPTSSGCAIARRAEGRARSIVALVAVLLGLSLRSRRRLLR